MFLPMSLLSIIINWCGKSPFVKGTQHSEGKQHRLRKKKSALGQVE
jgi:hypothetical protein